MTSNVQRLLAGVAVAVFFTLSPALAQETAAKRYFPDLPVVDQHAKSHRFYSDLVAGKVVVIHSFSTACTTQCPIVARNLSAIQESLGDRLGRDAVILSITVDPATDTPAKLQEYSARNEAKAGWFFLTGTKENVDHTLYKLGQYVDDPKNHKHVMIIGNPMTGLWKKALGTAEATELLTIVDSVLNDSSTAK